MMSKYLTRLLMVAVAFAFLSSLPLAKLDNLAFAREGGWQQQAEKTFYLSEGMAQKVMNQDEWTQHQQKMRNMNPDERQKYTRDMHKRFMDEARNRGFSVPDVPAEHGKGTGTSRGAAS